MGDKKGALSLLERRCRLQRDTLGPDHPDVASTLFRQGTLCMENEGMDGESGVRFYAEALRIRRKAFGPDDPSVGDALHRLGSIKVALAQRVSLGEGGQRQEQERRRHRPDEALELLWDALRIRRQHHGWGSSGDSLKEAETLAVLGDVHRAYLSQNETAAELYGECLEIRTRRLGSDHERVAEAHEALGSIREEMGDGKEAVEHYRAALSIFETISGETDDRVLELTRLLGNAEYSTGEVPRAKLHLERFVDLMHQAPEDGQHDLDRVVDALHVLGKVRRDMGEYSEARDAYSEAQRIYAVSNGRAARRATVGRELLEGLRNLEPSDDEGDFLSEMNNPIVSFIQKVNRSMSMEHASATTADHLANQQNHGTCSSSNLHCSTNSNSRIGSIMSHTLGAQKTSTEHGIRKSSMDMSTLSPHAARSLKSNADMNHASLGSVGSGSRRKAPHHAGRGSRKSSMDLSPLTSRLLGSAVGSIIGSRKSSMGPGPTTSHKSSMDLDPPSSPDRAVASGQNLSASAGSREVMRAKDHLWASQCELNAEALFELFSEKDGRYGGVTGAALLLGEETEQVAGSCRASNSSEHGALNPPESNRNTSIIKAVQAAHNSLQSRIVAFCEYAEVAQHQCLPQPVGQ
mmetsp:Transcript_40636/g.122318  ORF Transcript_40636/g.122318 Transcript_40636/m.122318 type:complete len:634 (-) Transcript_40636:132-2033(-)